MATFTATRSSKFIFNPQISSRSEGNEGRELNNKINQINQFIEQTESIKRWMQSWKAANKGDEEHLQAYLDSLRSEALENNEVDFTLAVLAHSWQAWKLLSDYFSNKDLCLEVPDACPDQKNNFMFTWSKSEHYLECEIFGNGEIEFFYRNRKSGKVWGEDTTLEQGFSASILEKASIFSW